ncbi:NAD(P)H-dependent oxidoreductase [bacterium]|nr:NAD(P)H-dependent oxidoreductase [bacterium]
MTKKVLFIIGSLRKKSFNRQLAAKCREILMQKGAEISELEYSDIPFMNQDAEMPVPASINRVRAEVAAADGIWIFTPEYNFAVPGVLKNLLDWLSRPLVPGDFTSGTAIAGKKVTISGVGGKNATQNVRADLKKLLDFMKMEVIFGEGNGFAADGTAFQTDVLTLNEGNIAVLEKQAEEFLKTL